MDGVSWPHILNDRSIDVVRGGDKDVCQHKDGRYCTKGDILAKFESIKEEDERSPEQFLADELDDTEGAGDMGYDESFGVDEYGDEYDGEEPED